MVLVDPLVTVDLAPASASAPRVARGPTTHDVLSADHSDRFAGVHVTSAGANQVLLGFFCFGTDESLPSRFKEQKKKRELKFSLCFVAPQMKDGHYILKRQSQHMKNKRGERRKKTSVLMPSSETLNRAVLEERPKNALFCMKQCKSYSMSLATGRVLIVRRFHGLLVFPWDSSLSYFP